LFVSLGNRKVADTRHYHTMSTDIGRPAADHREHSPALPHPQIQPIHVTSSEETPSFQAAKQPQHHGSIQFVKEVKVSENSALRNEEGKDHEHHDADRNKQPSQAWKKHMQEKLFHRTQEEETVLRCYESMVQGEPACSLLLVTGASGSGKTRLVKHTLQKRVRDAGGYFLVGKFDQLQRPEPYRGFVAAFTEFTSQVVKRGPEAVKAMRESIEDVVGDDCCVLTSMIPALGRILGDHENDSSKARADDAIQRFVFAFRMFLRAVSSQDQPVVLLLDDLHYADFCSLDVLTHQVRDLKNNPGLFIVGTCDDSDRMTNDTYLAFKLREMEKGGVAPIEHVSLRNLEPGEVNHLLGNALHLSRLEQSESLGAIVSAQTKGNMFYIIEFVRWLQDSGLLSFDESTGTWQWDSDEISMTINVCRVGDFLVDRLELLPMDTRDVLKVAACFGSHLDEKLIEYVLGRPVGDIVVQAAAKGILVFDETHGNFAFEHDGMQSAAYNLIPEDGRELFHLEVGRRLWRHLNKDELDRHIFLVLSQMNIGRRLITREKERYAVATLCLHAGRKAAKSSTFRTAAVYLNLAIYLLELQDRCWHDDYDLTLAVYNAAAEMEMCTANYEAMDRLTGVVLKNARSSLDKIQSFSTRIYGLGVADRPNEALDLGIEVLASVGERFPRILCRQHLMQGMKRVRRLLRGKSNEQILRMANIEEREKLSSLQILNLMFLPALLNRPKLAPFITLKLMRITLEDGLSMIAPATFAIYGMLCISARGDVDAAWRYGELGMELLEQLEVREYLPRVYAAFYGCVYPWKKPLRDILHPLQHAYRVGMQTGDGEFAALCANLYEFNALDAGVPLHQIEEEWSSLQEMMMTQQQKQMLRMSWPCMQAIHHYMGKTDDPLASKGDIVDLDEMLQFGIENKLYNSVLSIRVLRMMLAYIFNDYGLACSLRDIAIKDMWSMPPVFNSAIVGFIGGMVALAVAAEGKSVWRNIRQAKKILKRLKGFARSCPSNFLDKKFLLEAELASVCGDDAKAVENYLCAIALAKEMKFLCIQAIANERMARHYVSRRNLTEAAPFFRRAIALFTEWDGHAKVERLTAEVEALYNEG